MTIIQKYILKNFLQTLFLCVSALTLLFMIFDFFDRIDNIVAEKPSVFLVAEYFLYKIPVMLSQTLPLSVLIASMLSLAVLSKNSEITAMRATGMTIFWITKPVLLSGIFISVFALLLNEFVVPGSNRRLKEIYNIDIHKKDLRGGYSQSDIWWRTGDDFFSVSQFDSRTETLHEVNKFETDKKFNLIKRTDADTASWIDPALGWSMKDITEYRFDLGSSSIQQKKLKALPLPIKETPSDFYAKAAEPMSMSYFEMRSFIKKQQESGLSVSGYMADLYNKFAFPFICFIVSALAIPFSLRTARSGTMANSVLAAIGLGFMYYAMHSFSIAMGRAEIWPPLLAAWMTNIVMLIVAIIFNLGAEAPN
jgi:lipopolysaccharide export system permease protein